MCTYTLKLDLNFHLGRLSPLSPLIILKREFHVVHRIPKHIYLYIYTLMGDEGQHFFRRM